jgi:hypothetical protein
MLASSVSELELKGPQPDATLEVEDGKIAHDVEWQTSPMQFDSTPEVPYRVDGGWTAWLCVLVGFFQLILSLGLGFSFGVYQAHYHLVAFPAASNSVRFPLTDGLREAAARSRLIAVPP